LPSAFEFRILGPLEVLEDGRPISLQGTKPRALLAVLVLHANEPIPTGELIEALWGDRPPETVAKVLQTYVSQLRKALSGDGVALVTRPGAYVLEVAPGSIDLARFEELHERGRASLSAGRPEAAAAALRDALALWRGPALAEFRNEPFAVVELRRLEEARLAALEDRLEADLGCGRGRELVPELESLVAEHPLRERLRGQLMVALYRAGRQADALRIYREGRAKLVEELGLEPGPELQRLEKSILVQEASLDAPLPASPPAVNGRPRMPARAMFWTRRRVLLAIASVFVAGIVAAALGLRLGSGSGDVVVAPNSVAVIDADTERLETSVGVGVEPQGIAVSTGAVWVANRADRTVSRLDLRTAALVRTIPVGVYPSAVAALPGAVWVASGPLGRLVRIDATSNKPSRPRSSGIDCGGLGASLAIGPPNTLWIACDVEPGAVRVDLRSARVVPFAYRAGLLTGSSGSDVPHFSALAYGNGTLWIADRAQDRVTAIDPATNLAGRQISVGREPVAIAVGFGWIWVANSRDSTVSRIELRAPGRPPRVETITVGLNPVALAVDPSRGSVWVANAGSRSVSRLDPQSGEVKATVRLGNKPMGIAVGPSRVFVTVGAS
jgi:YVTN family beta-propeller protein